MFSNKISFFIDTVFEELKSFKVTKIKFEITTDGNVIKFVVKKE